MRSRRVTVKLNAAATTTTATAAVAAASGNNISQLRQLAPVSHPSHNTCSSSSSTRAIARTHINTTSTTNSTITKVAATKWRSKSVCRASSAGIKFGSTIICLLLHFSIYCYHITETYQAHNDKEHSMEPPSFDDINPRNVSAVADETAILKCRVKNKGNRTVSWMRKRDLHILTTNIYTYTGDQRFSVLHTPGTDDWDLKIDYAQQRDSGIYECQVNTEPKINLAIVLDVTAESDLKEKSAEPQFYDAKAARAKILGSTEIHVKRDSTIALACSVNMHASSVSWYHGAAIVDFDSLRGGISLETEKTDVGTTSRLMLTRASLRDSGNYTCVPNGAIPASVRVHVLTGEQPAAMQTSKGGIALISAHLMAVGLICVALMALWQRQPHHGIISQTTSMKEHFFQLQQQQQYKPLQQQQQQQQQQQTQREQQQQRNVHFCGTTTTSVAATAGSGS